MNVCCMVEAKIKGQQGSSIGSPSMQSHWGQSLTMQLPAANLKNPWPWDTVSSESGGCFARFQDAEPRDIRRSSLHAFPRGISPSPPTISLNTPICQIQRHTNLPAVERWAVNLGLGFRNPCSRNAFGDIDCRACTCTLPTRSPKP